MKPERARSVLLVTRFDECFRFYRDVMDFNVGWGKEGDSYATFFVDEHIRLSIFKRGFMAEEVGTSGLPSEAESQDRIAITFGVKDVVEAAKDLKRKGAKFVTPVIEHPDWGVRTTYLRDPDGNLLQLESVMRKEEWTEALRKEAALYEPED